MAIIKVKTGGITADAVTDALIADDVVGTEHLTANEVDTTALGADAVTGAQLADNAVNSEHYTDGSIDTAHIADAQITTAKLSTAVLTGATDIGAAIADADLFLVDDGAGGTLRKTAASRLKTYTAVASTPNFFVRRTSNVTIGSNNVSTKITFDEEDYDVGSAYNTSDGKFTPQVAGKYFILIQARFADTSSSTDIAQAVIYKNGSGIISNGVGFDADYAPYIQTSGIVQMNGSSDYIEGYTYQRLSQIDITGNSGNATFMTGYRIIE
jgi:hypothetical protein